jgi:RHH-type proline utilization regulon transcriptional repressor/proline dehydrogenase/delta 1-pyrroline-5-carboxylate dehydrogenase
MAMRLMGEQFVTGENISEALANSRKFEARGFRYSYDMLGEAATTEADAQRYYASYEQAIHAIGKAAGGRGIYEGPGISIKLSALHPRYARSQYERTMNELLPRVRSLAILARRYDIGLNIDAESRWICSKRFASIRNWRAGTALASWCRPIRSAARS